MKNIVLSNIQFKNKVYQLFLEFDQSYYFFY